MNRASGLVVAALLLNAGCEVSRDGSPSNAQTMPSDHSGRPSTSSPESRRDPAPDRYASAEDAITDETAPAPILQLTEETFEQQVLMSDRPVLVEFCAPWCGPCRRFEPTIDALAREYDGRVIVAKIDFDMNRQLAERYNIRRTPTVLILRQGRVVEEVAGLASKSDLTERITAQLTAHAESMGISVPVAAAPQEVPPEPAPESGPDLPQPTPVADSAQITSGDTIPSLPAPR